MKTFSIVVFSLSMLLLSSLTPAQQTAQTQQAEPIAQAGSTAQNNTAVKPRSTETVQVNISTTISGNQEQPRTLYVLPWQHSIAQIRIAAPDINVPAQPIQPLDRRQFLRFIEAQSLQQQPGSTASTDNN
ncbi:hypothetical protein [Arsukibacterium indicum]|uniref:Uncharacterized protein n=1 Tax=Arsukibacterium indicum TaxID=2848612 RepID=A0ABS6MIW8_9GAMM|nr:hypothetical protein [Arsukibacterium indicum]MBV2128314.1 hypothetical protein [Arsukibacterium indicum]